MSEDQPDTVEHAADVEAPGADERALDGLAAAQRDAAAILRESRELLDATAAQLAETQRQLHEQRDRADAAEAGRARQGDGTDAP